MVKVDLGVSHARPSRTVETWLLTYTLGGHKRRDDLAQGGPSPQAGSSPSFGTASTPLLGSTGFNAAANPDQATGAAAGLLTPVTGLLGSTTGTVKGVLGTTTGTLNGLLGNTPLGPLVGTVGGIGNGLLDKVGTIGNGGLGLGTILKPVGDTLGGLPLVGPIVGPIAGGLAGTVGGLNLAQQTTPTPNVSPQLNQFGQVVGMGMQVPNQYGQLTGSTIPMPTVQQLEETIVGRLADGRFVTNTGRVLGLGGDGGDGAVSGLPVQVPAGLDGAGQLLRPITSNPALRGPISGLPNLGAIGGGLPQLGGIGGGVPQLGGIGSGLPQLGGIGNGLPSTDLSKIVANLPPGLGQILQPIGSADRYLQIGNQLVPLGNLNPAQLAQLGLDRLPVTPVNAGFGYPSVNYLQDGEVPEQQPQPEDVSQSKEVQANPVTTWMDGGNSTTAGNGTFPMPDNSTANMPDEPTMNTTPLNTKSQIPITEQMQVQPLQLAPPSMSGNQTAAGKPHSIIKGDQDQWYEVKFDGGDTFERIASEMSGQEKNYYSGGSRDPGTTSPDTQDGQGTGSGSNGQEIVIAPGYDGHKGRVGWQDVKNGSSTTHHQWHSTQSGASATSTMATSMTSSMMAEPTTTPAPTTDDARTYAWSEDWGDWVSADYGDSDLQVGWDTPSTDPAMASATTSMSVPKPTSSTMAGNTSAGLS